MSKKIAALIIVLIFSLCCVSIAFAENGTTNASDAADDSESIEVEDSGNYITITGISNGEIRFSDGFTGYAMDASKGKIGSDDKFAAGEFSNSKIENYIKLAIIEAYKQGKENNLGGIISKIADNNMDSSDSIISEVMKSSDNIGSSEVVKINDNTEATFTFELLKSTDDEKSDCLAYKVSMKTVESDKLAASDDVDNTSEDNKQDTTGNDNNDDKAEDTNKNKTTDDNSDDKAEDTNKNNKADNNNKSEKTSKNDDVKKEAKKNNAEKEKPKNNTTIVKTTTTVIENNTTIVHNNVKEVNNTTEPKNDTAGNLLKAGNPILILIIVVVVVVIAVVIMKRKN